VFTFWQRREGYPPGMVTVNKTHEAENKGFSTGFMVVLDGRRYGLLATFRRLAKPQFNPFPTLSDGFSRHFGE
jgi:hypothetical protein